MTAHFPKFGGLILTLLMLVSAPDSFASWTCTGTGQTAFGDDATTTCSGLIKKAGFINLLPGVIDGNQCFSNNEQLMGTCSGSDGPYDAGCESNESWNTLDQECQVTQLTDEQLRAECQDMVGDPDINWVWPRSVSTTGNNWEAPDYVRETALGSEGQCALEVVPGTQVCMDDGDYCQAKYRLIGELYSDLTQDEITETEDTPVATIDFSASNVPGCGWINENYYCFSSSNTQGCVSYSDGTVVCTADTPAKDSSGNVLEPEETIQLDNKRLNVFTAGVDLTETTTVSHGDSTCGGAGQPACEIGEGEPTFADAIEAEADFSAEISEIADVNLTDTYNTLLTDSEIVQLTDHIADYIWPVTASNECPLMGYSFMGTVPVDSWTMVCGWLEQFVLLLDFFFGIVTLITLMAFISRASS